MVQWGADLIIDFSLSPPNFWQPCSITITFDFLSIFDSQEYVLPDVKDRQYLITFHKNAKKLGLDVERYNQLKDQIGTLQNDLNRLRDPLTLRLPLKSGLPKDFDFSKIPGQETSYSAILHKLQAMLKKAQNNPT
ncbi:unnamed protein product [Allacma fusca]|uniref:Calcium uniporter protein C-terminal domain-containing protein n=1 Tax=Allacma fusca TaxID=39272 RepID=A0A8J2KT25_9HEXA|nr:unnamed protein product [Allacma fusca]